MRKIIFLCSFSFVLLAGVIVYSSPVHAQQRVNCPAGFTCTPISVSGTATTQSTGPSSNNMCYLFTQNIVLGMSSPDVAALQTWLIAYGYNIHGITNVGSSKGYYGVQTETALKQYQQSVGLPVTGILDVETRSKINASCSINNSQVTRSQVIASLDPASPLSSTIEISPSTVTQNVPLAVFDLKSQGNSTTLNSLSINLLVNKNSGTISIPTLFTNLHIIVGGQIYSETSLMGQVVTFSNLNIPLAANINVPVTIYGSVAQNIDNSLDGTYASVQLPLSRILVVDSTGNTVPVNQGTIAGTLSGSTVMFTTGSVPTVASVSPLSVNSGQSITIYGSNFSSPNTVVEFSLNAKGGGVTEDVSPNYVSPTQLSVIVPNDLASGSYSITVTNLSSGQSVQANSWLQITVNQSSVSTLCPAGFTCYSQSTNYPTITYPTQTINYPVQTQATYPSCNSSYTCNTHDQPTCKYSQNWNGQVCISSQDQMSVFTKNFNVRGITSQISLSITADNEYSVSINGTPVGMGNNYNYIDTYNITSLVHPGTNTIAITAVNEWDPTDGIAYSTNPAGLIYKITNSNGLEITASDGSEQVSGRNAQVLTGNQVNNAWPYFSGAQWIWDPTYVTGNIGTALTPTSNLASQQQSSLTASIWDAVKNYFDGH